MTLGFSHFSYFYSTPRLFSLCFIIPFQNTAATREMWLSHLSQLKMYGPFQTPYSKQYDELEYEIRAYDMIMLAIYQSLTSLIKVNLYFLFHWITRWMIDLAIFHATSINFANGPPVLNTYNLKDSPRRHSWSRWQRGIIKNPIDGKYS